MRDSVPSKRYSSVCNVLREWNISLIPTYRVYRLYDRLKIFSFLCAYIVHRSTQRHTHTHRHTGTPHTQCVVTLTNTHTHTNKYMYKYTHTHTHTSFITYKKNMFWWNSLISCVFIVKWYNISFTIFSFTCTVHINFLS